MMSLECLTFNRYSDIIEFELLIKGIQVYGIYVEPVDKILVVSFITLDKVIKELHYKLTDISLSKELENIELAILEIAESNDCIGYS